MTEAPAPEESREEGAGFCGSRTGRRRSPRRPRRRSTSSPFEPGSSQTSVTKPAGEITCLVLCARKAGAVWVAARPPHAMAANAELLASAAVARGARDRIDSRLRSVLSAPAIRREPARRVWASASRAWCDTGSGMAVVARSLGVASDAEPGLRARLLGVPRSESSSMKPRQLHLVECQTGRESRDIDPMTRGARSLAVARRAEIASARRPHTVLPQPISLVDHVARRERVLCLQIDMTTVAVTHRPLVLVLVATEACGHLGP